MPTCEGEYALHILCQGEDIPESPYIADILPAQASVNIGDLKKVQFCSWLKDGFESSKNDIKIAILIQISSFPQISCTGPGVSREGPLVEEETFFTVTGASNPEDIAVQVIDSDYRTLPIKKSSGPGLGSGKPQKFSYIPESSGKHTVMVRGCKMDLSYFEELPKLGCSICSKCDHSI